MYFWLKKTHFSLLVTHVYNNVPEWTPQEINKVGNVYDHHYPGIISFKKETPINILT